MPDTALEHEIHQLIALWHSQHPALSDAAVDEVLAIFAVALPNTDSFTPRKHRGLVRNT